MSGLGSRFDWYAATFEGFESDRIPTGLAVAVGADITVTRGRMGYAAQHVLERDGKVLARVFTGSARAGEVHVVTTSQACDVVVPVIRRMWPRHRVSRADSAVDFAADFDVIDAEVLAFAEERGISYRLVTDSAGGATRYVGSPRSDVMVRVYKKSEQMLAKHPESAAEIPAGLVRAEIQARPPTRIKSALSWMSADDVWGLGGWTRDFAGTFLQFEPERVPTHFRQASDWEKALHWLGRQYGPVVRRRVEQIGREAAAAEVLTGLGLRDG